MERLQIATIRELWLVQVTMLVACAETILEEQSAIATIQEL